MSEKVSLDKLKGKILTAPIIYKHSPTQYKRVLMTDLEAQNQVIQDERKITVKDVCRHPTNKKITINYRYQVTDEEAEIMIKPDFKHLPILVPSEHEEQ